MKTKAEKWGMALDAIPRQDDGTRDYNVWTRTLRDAIAAARRITEECPDSYDSSITLTFDDGSQIYVGNPAQAAFAGFVVYE